MPILPPNIQKEIKDRYAQIDKIKDYEHRRENPKEAFSEYLVSFGYEPPQYIKDGVFDRIRDAHDLTKKGIKKTGWYIFNQYEDISIATFGTFHNDEKETWLSKEHIKLNASQRNQYNEVIRRNAEIQKIEKDREHEEKAIEAAETFKNLKTQKGKTAYLEKKQVEVVGDVKISDDIVYIPVVCGDKIWSFQKIFSNGDKRFLKGGKKKGCYFKIEGDNRKIYITEGYATGASIYMATGSTVYVAFDAGNLFDVFLHVKAENKDSQIIMAGENNQASKNKLDHIQTDSVFPPDVECDDLNDYHCKYGLEALKELLSPTVEISEEKKPEKQGASFKFNGFLGDVVDYYNATSGNNQPFFAIQTAITLGSIFLGRNFVTNLDNKTSLYLLNIGKSSTGKDHAKTVLNKILEATGKIDLFAGSGYTSSAAVTSALEIKPRHLTVIDEFSKYLEASNNQNSGGNLKTANSKLMEAITSCCNNISSMAYSTRGILSGKNKEIGNNIIKHPAITMLCMSTPDDFFNNLGAGAIKDGFINRFIVCISDAKREPRRHKERLEVPTTIIEWVSDIDKRLNRKEELFNENPHEEVLTFNREAMDEIVKFEYKCIKLMDKLDQFGMAELCGRSNEMAMRLSLIVALSRDANAKEIIKEDILAAVNYIEYNLKIFIDKAKMNISASRHEADKKEILQAIRDSKDGITWVNMQKRAPFSKHKKRELKEILESLTDAQLIEQTTLSDGGKGRPSIVWKKI